MKHLFLAVFLIISAASFVACDDAVDNLGGAIQPSKDGIVVMADTFHLDTETKMVENIISRPDSFLLGQFQDEKFGVTTASILSEVKLFKDGFTFLDTSVATTKVDSVVVSLSFGSVFGSVNSPIHIGIYELKDSLKRNQNYNSDIDLSPFVDYSKIIADTVFTVKDGLTGKINRQLRFHVKPQFKQRFFTLNPADYKNQDAFRNFFKGMYITTEYFGNATMLNVQAVKLTMYYSYAYHSNPTEKIKGIQDFYVNTEVKRVNRVVHPIRNNVTDVTNNYNFVASPANYYTRIRIPLDRIRNNVNVGSKVLEINQASIKINIKKKTEADNSYLPYNRSLLLIKEDALNRFFSKREALSDTCSFLSNRDSTYISTDNYSYHFAFSGLSKLIDKELKEKDNLKPYIDMVLVPVTPVYTQTSAYGDVTITEINQSNQMQTTTIFGGKNSENPMRMEIIYSGF
jgi:hypothetical protein